MICPFFNHYMFFIVFHCFSMFFVFSIFCKAGCGPKPHGWMNMEMSDLLRWHMLGSSAPRNNIWARLFCLQSGHGGWVWLHFRNFVVDDRNFALIDLLVASKQPGFGWAEDHERCGCAVWLYHICLCSSKQHTLAYDSLLHAFDKCKENLWAHSMPDLLQRHQNYFQWLGGWMKLGNVWKILMRCESHLDWLGSISWFAMMGHDGPFLHWEWLGVILSQSESSKSKWFAAGEKNAAQSEACACEWHCLPSGKSMQEIARVFSVLLRQNMQYIAIPCTYMHAHARNITKICSIMMYHVHSCTIIDHYWSIMTISDIYIYIFI